MFVYFFAYADSVKRASRRMLAQHISNSIRGDRPENIPQIPQIPQDREVEEREAAREACPNVLAERSEATAIMKAHRENASYKLR